MADNQTAIAKLPPQSLETEASLLGCLLIDKDAIFKIADILRPEDFYKDSHGLIYSAMRELYIHHEPIDILTLTTKLEEKNQLEAVGGRTYIAELGNTVATSAHVVHYANTVQRK
ncbi:replicative DNA helicase, partial [Candidatus Falkowbacteria bacterium]|nr:replicative DNA helicase [Candidatus Falkowbacteria bacterium]